MSSMNMSYHSSVIKKIQQCLLGFIASTSITTNKEYRNEMRKYINEILIETKISIKDLSGLYLVVNSTIKDHISFQLNGQIRRRIIASLQRGNMTEDEADLIKLFNIDELKESVFHMYKYFLFENVTRYMNSIPMIIDFNNLPNYKIIELHINIAKIINKINVNLFDKYKKESNKVYYRIIMTDEQLSIIKLAMKKLIDIILDKTYRSLTAYIIDTQ